MVRAETEAEGAEAEYVGRRAVEKADAEERIGGGGRVDGRDGRVGDEGGRRERRWMRAEEAEEI